MVRWRAAGGSSGQALRGHRWPCLTLARGARERPARKPDCGAGGSAPGPGSRLLRVWVACTEMARAGEAGWGGRGQLGSRPSTLEGVGSPPHPRPRHWVGLLRSPGASSPPLHPGHSPPRPPQTQVPRGGHLGGSFMPGATSGLAVARTGGCAFQPAWRRPAHLQSLCSPVVGGGRGHGAVRGTTEGWWQWQTAGGTFTVAAAPPRAHSAGPRAPPSILFLRSPSGLPPAPFPSSTPPPTHAHSNGSRLAPAAAVRRGGDAPRLQALCLLHGALPAASLVLRSLCGHTHPSSS